MLLGFRGAGALAALLVLLSVLQAPAPAVAQGENVGQCNDGSYQSSTCRYFGNNCNACTCYHQGGGSSGCRCCGPVRIYCTTGPFDARAQSAHAPCGEESS